jgi:methionyl-tRNA formyltransferase
MNNFIRALNDPYPNAFFKLKNRLIFITKIRKIKKKNHIVTIDNLKVIPRNIKGHYLQIKDCFIEILKGYSSL